MSDVTFIDSKVAFAEAINCGELSDDEAQDNYAGHYMYMGTWDNTNGVKCDWFKNRDYRDYLEIEYV